MSPFSRSAPLKKQVTSHSHPLDPLTSAEILATSRAVRKYSDALKVPLDRLLFNSITLREPPKLSVLKWAGVVQDPEVQNADSEIVRQAEVSSVHVDPLWLREYVQTLRLHLQVHCLDAATARAFECIVDLPSNLPSYGSSTSESQAIVSTWTSLPGTTQPSLQVEELLWAEEICRADKKIVAALAEVNVKPEDCYVDGERYFVIRHCFKGNAIAHSSCWSVGWCIGIDERFPGRRLQQCFLFTKLRPNDNLYGHPLDMIPVIGMSSLQFPYKAFRLTYTRSFRLVYGRMPCDRLPPYQLFRRSFLAPGPRNRG